MKPTDFKEAVPHSTAQSERMPYSCTIACAAPKILEAIPSAGTCVPKLCVDSGLHRHPHICTPPLLIWPRCPVCRKDAYLKKIALHGKKVHECF